MDSELKIRKLKSQFEIEMMHGICLTVPGTLSHYVCTLLSESAKTMTYATFLSLNSAACVCAQLLSHIQLFVAPWAVAHQVPLSMRFPSKNTGVGCHFLVQGIFKTQRANLCLLHWQAGSLSLGH